jgi:hypothetical protein
MQPIGPGLEAAAVIPAAIEEFSQDFARTG